MSARGWWIGGAALLAVACSPGGEPAERTAPAPAEAAAPAPARPNVLLVTLDTTRADALGTYGQERPTSPALDALADRGAVFEAAYSASPSTLPSHATILTGRLPFAHGARSNTGYTLAPANRTLAEVFAEAGYVTAAEVATPVIGRRTGIDQGFDHFRDLDAFDVERKRVPGPGGVSLPQDERPAADVTRHGLAFLRAHRDESFFLWLHYFDPHQHYAPPPRWRDAIPDSPYHAEVRYADHEIGRVLDALEALELAKHTLVVVTADHGEGLGEHGENTHAFFVYDTTVRVPLMFAWPGEVRPGLRIPDVVRTADIAPTVLDLVGLPALMDVQGVSLADALRGGDRPALDAYGESLEPHALFDSSALRFLRRGSWKLVHKQPLELYDLARDPGERTDRAAQEPERTEALAEALRRWVIRDTRSHAEARTPVDTATRERLQALGYAAATPAAGFDDAVDVATPRGPDPNTKRDDIDRYNAGWAALRGGQAARAVEIFRDLHERHPESFALVHVLVHAGVAAGLGEANLPYIRRAIALDPLALEHRGLLAQTLAARGETDAALAALDEALTVEPCHAGLRALQSQLLNDAGRPVAQRAALRATLDACPDAVDARNDYAYLLATTPDPQVRDGAEALRLARALVEAHPGRPDYQDTLACALAATGAFADAARLGEQVLRDVEGRLPAEAVALYRAHLDAFREGLAIGE